VDNKLNFEINIQDWIESGLLKPSLFKASIATIEKDFVITKIGALSKADTDNLEKMLKVLC
jgi:mRNA interferase MazF